MKNLFGRMFGSSELRQQEAKLKAALELKAGLEREYEAVKEGARELEGELRKMRADYERSTSPTGKKVLEVQMRSKLADLKRLDAKVDLQARKVMIANESLKALQEIVDDLQNTTTVEDIEDLVIGRHIAAQNAMSVDKAVIDLRTAQYDPRPALSSAEERAPAEAANTPAEAERARQGSALPRDLEDELRALLPDN